MGDGQTQKGELMIFLMILSHLVGNVHAEVTIEDILADYRVVQLSLAKDEYDTAKDAAGELEKGAVEWLESASANDAQRPNVGNMEKGSDAIGFATEAKPMRQAFEVLAVGTVEYLRADTTLRQKYQLYYCSMAPGYRYWVQLKTDSKLMNPYFGTEMQQCGVKRPW